MRNKILITLLLSAIFLPFHIQAATIFPSTGGSVRFDLIPKDPTSFSQMKVQAVSYDINLDRSEISWYVNDTIVLSGIGQETLTLRTGAAGKPISVRLLAKENDRTVEKSMIINPGEVEIIWQSDAYVPPFYKGRAMPSPKSIIKITAIPKIVTENGTTIQKNDLNFEWKQNSNAFSSGLGKDSAEIMMGGLFGEETISVTVSNKAGNITAEKKITLRPENTEIIFYEENPTEGTRYNKSIRDDSIIAEKEFSLRAEPYFFSKPKSNSEKSLLFDWKINGNGVTPKDEAPKILTLRNETGQELLSTVSLSIKNTKRIFQESNSSVKIKSNPGFKF